MPTLVDKLNNLCEFLSDSYDINHGGCCFVSSIIARYLDKLNIKYNLIIFDDENRNENDVIYNVQNNCDDYEHGVITGYETCSHYCIEIISSDEEIGKGIINQSNCYDSDYYRFTIPRVTHENIDYILYRGSWNNAYKYYKYNNLISNMIHELFTEYENYTEKQSILSKMFAINEPSFIWGFESLYL